MSDAALLDKIVTEEERDLIRDRLVEELNLQLKSDSPIAFDAARSLGALIDWDTYPQRLREAEVNAENERLRGIVLRSDATARELENRRRDVWRWYAGTTGSAGLADALVREEIARFGELK